nr:hypothetical protein [Desulforamulus aquiferis]
MRFFNILWDVNEVFENKAKVAIVKPWSLGIDYDSREFKKMQKEIVKHYRKCGQ